MDLLTLQQYGVDNASTTKLFMAKKANLFNKLKEDLGVKTVLEEIILERIVMAYHWIFQAEFELAGAASEDKAYNPETYEALWNLVERANNQLIRNIEALSSLRRSPITIVVKQPGQVNVGNQQVNVTKVDGKESG